LKKLILKIYCLLVSSNERNNEDKEERRRGYAPRPRCCSVHHTVRLVAKVSTVAISSSRSPSCSRDRVTRVTGVLAAPGPPDLPVGLPRRVMLGITAWGFSNHTAASIPLQLGTRDLTTRLSSHLGVASHVPLKLLRIALNHCQGMGQPAFCGCGST